MAEEKPKVRIKNEQATDDLTKFVFFIMVVATILLMFFVYYYLDNWRATNVASGSAPPELLTTGALGCVELGCPPGTNFIGSVSGEVYHMCTSSYARSILPDNRVCFPSATEAVAQGYRESRS